MASRRYFVRYPNVDWGRHLGSGLDYRSGAACQSGRCGHRRTLCRRHLHARVKRGDEVVKAKVGKGIKVEIITDANGVPIGVASHMGDVTRLLNAVSAGDPQAAEGLWTLVYAELRALAAVQMARERPGHTFAPTALVNEAYLRLALDQDQSFANRRHFFAAAATAMRRILVEAARARGRDKRGGGRRRERADLDAIAADGSDDDLLALHEALERLAAADPQRAKLVELRFFAGLTLPEAAECLGVSLSTADRGWRFARAWLHAAMAEESTGEKNPPIHDVI